MQTILLLCFVLPIHVLTCGEEGEGDEEAVADEKSHLDLRFIFFFGIKMIHNVGFRIWCNCVAYDTTKRGFGFVGCSST